MINKMKCRICQETKELRLFRRDAKEANGHQNICKKCRSKHRSENGEYLRKRIYTYARKKGQNTASISEEYLEKILKEPCTYCGQELNELDAFQATCDHVYAITSKYGGANLEINILPACRACNSSKRALFAIEAFDQIPERFKPERLPLFVQRFVGGLIGRKLTASEVEYMIDRLREEAREVRRNEAKQCEHTTYV